MEKNNIREIEFDPVESLHPTMDYIDENIAIHRDIRDFPIIEDKYLRMKMHIILFALKGELQIDINAEPYTIREHDFLIIQPNDIITNRLPAPNFEGSILCISPRFIIEYISESTLWDKAFPLAKNPVVHLSEEATETFKSYGKLLHEKIEHKHAPYRREIVVSIIRAIFYELLANINGYTPYGTGLTKQSEVLFRRFINLLSETHIKPRNVSWYADQLCITPKHLSTVCKQISGKTAFVWINDFVAADMRNLLKSSNRSIKEIAEFLHFPNISFFGKFCRQHFGMSPTKYRKQLRTQKGGGTEG